MENHDEKNCEYLRFPNEVGEPDARNTLFVVQDPTTGQWRPITINDQHEAISKFKLIDHVPEEIVVQFETAKNLYLYAWHVYRFYPVSEHHALACLEFALRKRFDPLPKKYLNKWGKASLKSLLTYAIEGGFIKNEGFRRWNEGAKNRATWRYREEKIREMEEKDLENIILDESEIPIQDEDRKFDYINGLKEILPRIRNMYSHGTGSLHNQVLGTIEIVSEIINQIYSVQSKT